MNDIDKQVTGDIHNRLLDDPYRYELGEYMGDPGHERGLKFRLRDEVTGAAYTITVHRDEN